jgi:hypothetical protein
MGFDLGAIHAAHPSGVRQIRRDLKNAPGTGWRSRATRPPRTCAVNTRVGGARTGQNGNRRSSTTHSPARCHQ